MKCLREHYGRVAPRFPIEPRLRTHALHPSQQAWHYRQRPVVASAPGEGDIVSHEGEKVAGHRRDDGTLVAVSTRCTHLGCQLNWNAAERSWDCPCHGSRFNPEGRVLQGPAVRDLEPKPVPEVEHPGT